MAAKQLKVPLRITKASTAKYSAERPTEYIRPAEHSSEYLANFQILLQASFSRLFNLWG